MPSAGAQLMLSPKRLGSFCSILDGTADETRRSSRMPSSRAAFFRNQAEKCRRLAGTRLSGVTRESLLKLQRQYEHLARLAEAERGGGDDEGA